MKNILYLLFGIFLSIPAWACRLPPAQKIVVGCSYHCDFFYRWRLNNMARLLNYPLEIIDLRQVADLGQALQQVDAVLIPGGADINPQYYLESVTPELRAYTEANLQLVKFTKEGLQRDPLEYQLLRRYSSEDKFQQLPLLGICRGMQMMSVAQGIPLYLDIKTELGIKNRMHRFDLIHINSTSESLMQELHPSSSVRGFKLHHQGIRVDYFQKHEADFPLAKVSAYSNQGLIAEALEYTHRRALGVQYHPERSLTAAAAPVFKWLLTAACEYKNNKEEL